MRGADEAPTRTERRLDLKAFVILLNKKMYVRHHPIKHRPQRGDATGWRELVWTTDISRAEKFDSDLNALAFANDALARDALKHDQFEIVELQPRTLTPVGAA